MQIAVTIAVPTKVAKSAPAKVYVNLLFVLFNVMAAVTGVPIAPTVATEVAPSTLAAAPPMPTVSVLAAAVVSAVVTSIYAEIIWIDFVPASIAVVCKAPEATRVNGISNVLINESRVFVEFVAGSF